MIDILRARSRWADIQYRGVCNAQIANSVADGDCLVVINLIGDIRNRDTRVKYVFSTVTFCTRRLTSPSLLTSGRIGIEPPGPFGAGAAGVVLGGGIGAVRRVVQRSDARLVVKPGARRRGHPKTLPLIVRF